MRITEIQLRPANYIGTEALGGTATFEEGNNTLTFPLSHESIKTIEECAKRDYDEVVRKFTCG